MKSNTHLACMHLDDIILDRGSHGRVRSRYLRTDLGDVIVLMFYSYFNADDTIIYSTNSFLRLAHYHQHELNKVVTCH